MKLEFSDQSSLTSLIFHEKNIHFYLAIYSKINVINKNLF